MPITFFKLLTADCELPTILAAMKLFSIPNLFTLGNLLCGCLAIVFAFEGNLIWSAYLVGIAAMLDFFDGFLARLLKQHSPIGKELDSLADMVSFGVVPGIVMFKLIHLAIMHSSAHGMGWVNQGSFFERNPPLALAALMIPLFSALRLAKFNIDTRQSDSFIGVPTPANSILICSFPLILNVNAENYWAYASKSFTVFSNGPHTEIMGSGDICATIFLNPWVLISITVIMSLLLISEIPLFALKFKNFDWKGNEIRFIFLGLAAVMIALLHYIAIPLVIVMYVLLSVINNLLKKKVAGDT
jgi:CDP-diacylglycerol--serine O-phosphatidyltransferase